MILDCALIMSKVVLVHVLKICKVKEFDTHIQVLEIGNTETLSLLSDKLRKQYAIAYSRFK